MNRTETIITSLWKTGHTKLSTEIAKEEGISTGRFMELIQQEKVEPSRALKQEMQNAVRFNTAEYAFQFIDRNLENYLVVEEPACVILLPEAYLEELKQIDRHGFRKLNGQWVQF